MPPVHVTMVGTSCTHASTRHGGVARMAARRGGAPCRRDHLLQQHRTGARRVQRSSHNAEAARRASSNEETRERGGTAEARDEARRVRLGEHSKHGSSARCPWRSWARQAPTRETRHASAARRAHQAWWLGTAGRSELQLVRRGRAAPLGMADRRSDHGSNTRAARRSGARASPLSPATGRLACAQLASTHN